jgi:hypothetical protein
MFLPGCGSVCPPPDIEVEQLETNEWSGVTVYYKHHKGATSVYVTLETPEDVAAYKEKVEFLLKRLDEAELRMGVHEDKPVGNGMGIMPQQP